MEFSSGRARREVFSAGLEATALRQARMPAATARVSESDFGVRVQHSTFNAEACAVWRTVGFWALNVECSMFLPFN